MPLTGIPGHLPSPVVPLKQNDRLLQATEASTPGSVTTPSIVDTAQYVDSATIGTTTKLDGSYLVEIFTIHTTDFDWNPWAIAYTYDGSLQPAYGCVGGFDDDKGLI